MNAMCLNYSKSMSVYVLSYVAEQCVLYELVPILRFVPLPHLLRATAYATELYSIHMPHGSEPPFQHIEEARRHNQLVPSADSVRE